MMMMSLPPREWEKRGKVFVWAAEPPPTQNTGSSPFLSRGPTANLDHDYMHRYLELTPQ